ncbi:MAG: chloramphenicol acetyltransferase [Chloroflexota bacterium]
MRYIDLDTWPRRKHFAVFNAFDYPHFNVCSTVDVTTFYPAVKMVEVSLTVATTYVLAHVANTIPEFRYRIRDNQVVEHELVHPSITLLAEDDLFSYCTFTYTEDFSTFLIHATDRMTWIKEHPTLEDEPGQDDLLFMSSLPWVSFTGLMHPIHMNPVDSIPRLTWGKVFKEQNLWKMPLSVQAHHGLMDGLHAGRYFEQVQEVLNEPQWLSNLP